MKPFYFLLIMLVVGIVVSCGKDDPVEEVVEGIVEETKSEAISATSGGKIETKTGVKIEVPATAITSDKNITVEIVDPTIYENEWKIPEGLKGEKVSAIVRCGPEGTVFETPVKVTIPFYPELLHEQLSTDDIVVVSYSGDSLELLPFTIDRTNNLVIAEASHFSDIAVVTNLFEYEGYIYKTVIINGVEWMAENFRYLPRVNATYNGSEVEPEFGVANYHGTSVEEAKETEDYINYGARYNWHAAMQSCPVGWHLPYNNDWDQLLVYINEKRGPYPYHSKENTWNDINKHLKAKKGWIVPGLDDFGFSAVRTDSFNVDNGIIEYAGWMAADIIITPDGEENAGHISLHDFSYADLFVAGVGSEEKAGRNYVRYIRD